MKRILSLLAALALILSAASAETMLSVTATPASTGLTTTLSPTPTPSASPTPEPYGVEYPLDEFTVRLSDMLLPVDDEVLEGYTAAAQSDFPDSGEMCLVAVSADDSAAISFALAPSDQSAAEAAREAAQTILGSDAGVVETRFGENDCACFACAIGDMTFHIYYFALDGQLLTVTASGVEESDRAAILENLTF